MSIPKISATGPPTTPGPNGSLPLRREIRDLQANFKDQWNLYLLGLADIQKQSAADLLSYYQLAGIHGEPFVPWDGVTGNQSAQFGGYCTHSSILFATWHRPYLSLYEQALYLSIQTIASKFPSSVRARYVAAAKDFRIPYWDWAMRVTGQTSAVPTAVSSLNVTVVDVDGASKSIRNPLYNFHFDDKKIPSELALDSFWSQFGATVRSPDENGNQQDDQVARVITNESASLRNNVSLMLLSYKEFDAFSNNQWLHDEQPGNYGSLEDVHNEIHDKVGGNGHMSSLEVSAFDPIFWLHHTNVDRLWAIWQALHPDAYVIDKTASAREANFYITSNMPLTANTDLKPFYDASASKFWNSTEVKYTTPFGYAYPETQRWLYSSDSAYQTAVQNEVTKQYGGNVINNFFANIAPESVGGAAANSGSDKTDGAANFFKKAVAHPVQAAQKVLKTDSTPSNPNGNGAPGSADGASRQIKEADSSSSAPVPLNVPDKFAHLVPNRTYTEWITNLRALKHGLSQTFRVYVFLGDFNPDPATWPTEYNVVGRFTVLGRGGDTECDKCQQDRQDELSVTGTVPLTSALLQDIVEGRLASLEPGDVEAYLERNLHWRITGFDGTERGRADVPGLKVAVVSTSVRIGDDGLPVYSGVYEQHPDITDGRPAGLGAGDQI